jgi:hypothetical protein
MNRAQAVALIQYLNRAIGIVPTTGLEWDTLRGALVEIEKIANTPEAPKTGDPSA